MYSSNASYSNILPSGSQYGVLNATSDTQQWSNGKRANLGLSIPGLLPPYNVDHSVYVRYLKNNKKCYVIVIHQHFTHWCHLDIFLGGGGKL